MAWTIKYSEIAAKQMKKFDKSVSRIIDDYLHRRIATQPDPTIFGKPSLNDKSGIWRYRVQHYRILCEFKNNELIVLVLRIGHRKEVYKS